MINFPSSPSAGQKFMSGKTLYTFINGAWRASLGTALPFNYLVNPAFQISQEQGNNFGSVTGFYPADQWSSAVSALTVGIQRFATTDPTLSPYYVQWYVPTAKPALAVGDYTFLLQNLEGSRIRDLQWGTAAAKPVVVRFTAFTTLNGTYSFSLRNYPGSRSYVVPVVLTGTQTVYEIPIPGDTAGTWYDANAPSAAAMQWGLCGASGSTYLTSAPNTWAVGNFIGHTGMSNLAAQSTKTIVVGRAGIYADPNGTGKAPLWECPSDHQAILESMRYWYKAGHARGFVVSATAGGRMALNHPVPIRAQPTIGIGGTTSVLYDIAAAPPLTSLAGPYGTSDLLEFDATGAAGGMVPGRACIYTSTTPANYIAVNARM